MYFFKKNKLKLLKIQKVINIIEDITKKRIICYKLGNDLFIKYCDCFFSILNQTNIKLNNLETF